MSTRISDITRESQLARESFVDTQDLDPDPANGLKNENEQRGEIRNQGPVRNQPLRLRRINAAPQELGIEQQLRQARKVGLETAPSIGQFRIDPLEIEALLSQSQTGPQTIFQPTSSFQPRDIGDVPITIPEPEFTTPSGGSATLSLPGSGQRLETFLEEKQRGVSQFAERVGSGIESRVPVVGGAAGQVARGGIEAISPPGIALSVKEGAEAARFLATGPGRVTDRAKALAGQAGPQALGAAQFAGNQPFRFLGGAATAVGGGVAAGKVIQGAPGAARAASIRGRGGQVFDFEELSDPPRTSGELPAFTERAVSDPDVAVREFRRQARTGGLAEETGQPVIFHGRSPEAVQQFGTFGQQFEAPAGSSEIPGLFQSADLSPLRVGGAAGSGGFGIGLPRPTIRTGRVVAEADPTVRRMPGSVQSLRDAGRFMEEADPGASFVRSERLITPEQEAIAPPGAGFQGGQLFGVRAGSEVVPGRVFQRGAGGDVDVDASTAVLQGDRALSRLRRGSQDRTPFLPVSSPFAASVGGATIASQFGTQAFQRGVGSGASGGGFGSGEFTSGSPTGTIPGPSGIPPTSSAPPTGPPSFTPIPPTNVPPTRVPPRGPPTIPPTSPPFMPPVTPPPRTPLPQGDEFPDRDPRSDIDRGRFVGLKQKSPAFPGTSIRVLPNGQIVLDLDPGQSPATAGRPPQPRDPNTGQFTPGGN